MRKKIIEEDEFFSKSIKRSLLIASLIIATIFMSLLLFIIIMTKQLIENKHIELENKYLQLTKRIY